MTMAKRDLEAEFEALRGLLIGLRRADDNGPILTIEDVVAIDRVPGLIEGRIRYIDERAPGRPVRTSDFDYETKQMAVDGPEDAADLLIINLEEDLLAAE